MENRDMRTVLIEALYAIAQDAEIDSAADALKRLSRLLEQNLNDPELLDALGYMQVKVSERHKESITRLLGKYGYTAIIEASKQPDVPAASRLGPEPVRPTPL